ncbi:MAG: hypothetical protein AABX71_00995 [Nanoarchaeota archaeon]
MHSKINVNLFYRARKFKIRARKLGFFGMIRGLMFRRSIKDNLLFEFPWRNKWRIHSWFVFFPFLAIWIRKDRVFEWKIVKPWRTYVTPNKSFDKLIEIPLSNSKIVNLIVGKKEKFK